LHPFQSTRKTLNIQERRTMTHAIEVGIA